MDKGSVISKKVKSSNLAKVIDGVSIQPKSLSWQNWKTFAKLPAFYKEPLWYYDNNYKINARNVLKILQLINQCKSIDIWIICL